MKICWYPGHMHKARRQLINTLGTVQAVIDVIDARAPAASSNPLLAELTRNHPRLTILNKADLAEPTVTTAWQRHFQDNTPNNLGCLVTGLDKQHMADLLLQALQPVEVGLDKVLATAGLVTGIPNTGKSTLINALAGRKSARTGNEPAITRGQQRIKLNPQWTLVDSPGMLWPDMQDQRAALCLALTGAIPQTALDMETIGWYSAELLLALKAPALCRRYRLRARPDSTEQLMQGIARQIGARGKAGSIDWYKTATTLLTDYRSGKLGRISLESPPA